VFHIQTRVLIANVLCGLIALGGSALLVRAGLPAWSAAAGAALAVLACALVSARVATSPSRRALRALHDGVLSFAESDFATRLALPSPDEVGDLVAVFNRMGAVLREERAELIQRELLLDALLQGAPMAILLLDHRQRVVFANTACRRVFQGVTRLNGRLLPDIVALAPEALQGPLRRGEDSLVTWDHDGQEESYRVLVRSFHLNTVSHRLLVIERITHELARQEAATWKKAIRVMSHELNNSLAPVSSLAHSARVAAGRPDAATRLPPLLDTIAERVAHVTTFLDGYARFARLPAPRPDHVPLAAFLDGVAQLFPFTLDTPVGTEVGFFDPTQIQQVLINLLKNAEESGGPATEIRMQVEVRNEALVLTVLDRGIGMDEETMRKALLPFHSFKKAGSGLGLSLCSEIVEAHGGRLHLARRAEGGLAVSVWLPSKRR
jgi:two-component system, NtrC family, nitrogen regulation sensor histidine kinase NtrY